MATDVATCRDADRAMHGPPYTPFPLAAGPTSGKAYASAPCTAEHLDTDGSTEPRRRARREEGADGLPQGGSGFLTQGSKGGAEMPATSSRASETTVIQPLTFESLAQHTSTSSKETLSSVLGSLGGVSTGEGPHPSLPADTSSCSTQESYAVAMGSCDSLSSCDSFTSGYLADAAHLDLMGEERPHGGRESGSCSQTSSESAFSGARGEMDGIRRALRRTPTARHPFLNMDIQRATYESEGLTRQAAFRMSLADTAGAPAEDLAITCRMLLNEANRQHMRRLRAKCFSPSPLSGDTKVAPLTEDNHEHYLRFCQLQWDEIERQVEQELQMGNLGFIQQRILYMCVFNPFTNERLYTDNEVFRRARQARQEAVLEQLMLQGELSGNKCFLERPVGLPRASDVEG